MGNGIKEVRERPRQRVETTKLTRRQQNLVELMVSPPPEVAYDENGKRRRLTQLELAKLAGYSDNDAGRVQVHRTLKLPYIQQAIFERVAQEVGTSAVEALHTMLDLTKYAKSERVRREAASDILDRGGFKAPDRVDHRHEMNISIDLS